MVGAATLACVSAPVQEATRSAVQPGTFTIEGNPESRDGATWTFRGKVDGVTYDLTGTLMKPAGPGPFPAVVLNHGFEGNAANLAHIVGPTMLGWGLVCIAPNYTHSSGAPMGAPGGANDRGASKANVQRLHMTRALLDRLGYVDMSRLAMHGHSMGAYLEVAEASAYPSEFRLASTTGGGIRPDGILAGPAPTSAQARGIRIPFSMHHGDADETVPLDFDRRLAAILEEHHVPHELFIYPGGHLAPRANAEMFERVHAWYATYGMF